MPGTICGISYWETFGLGRRKWLLKLKWPSVSGRLDIWHNFAPYSSPALCKEVKYECTLHNSRQIEAGEDPANLKILAHYNIKRAKKFILSPTDFYFWSSKKRWKLNSCITFKFTMDFGPVAAESPPNCEPCLEAIKECVISCAWS